MAQAQGGGCYPPWPGDGSGPGVGATPPGLKLSRPPGLKHVKPGGGTPPGLGMAQAQGVMATPLGLEVAQAQGGWLPPFKLGWVATPPGLRLKKCSQMEIYRLVCSDESISVNRPIDLNKQ